MRKRRLQGQRRASQKRVTREFGVPFPLDLKRPQVRAEVVVRNRRRRLAVACAQVGEALQLCRLVRIAGNQRQIRGTRGRTQLRERACMQFVVEIEALRVVPG